MRVAVPMAWGWWGSALWMDVDNGRRTMRDGAVVNTRWMCAVDSTVAFVDLVHRLSMAVGKGDKTGHIAHTRGQQWTSSTSLSPTDIHTCG